ncbi:MAG: glycosyltransferase family 2 protein [Gammaproteobacteria bacterium]
MAIWVLSALRPRRLKTTEGNLTPSITLIVVAHNEASRIRARLENFLQLDYPEKRLEILLASDGSTDRTVENAQSIGSSLVRVIEFKTRRGKSAVLNDVVPIANGELVVFADARQSFEAGVLRTMADVFMDPKVGAASGELMLVESADRSEVKSGVGFYWRYEKFIRLHESRVDSTVGSTGAIYAIRKALFKPIPDSVILDDVLIPMRVVRQGYRAWFEPRARAYDHGSNTMRREFQRKLRTIAGNFQLFYLEPWLLSPFVNRLWLQTVSHKLMRLLSPLLLCIAFIANLLVVGETFYGYVFAAQVVFYAAALAGFLASRGKGAKRCPFYLNIPYTFCVLNAATIVAFFSLLAGRQRVTWNKTD